MCVCVCKYILSCTAVCAAEPRIIQTVSRLFAGAPAGNKSGGRTHNAWDEKPVPENLPVKAVIALMAAAAALRAAQAGRASQKCTPHPQPPPVSLFLRKLSRERRSTSATVDGVRKHHPDFYPHAQFFYFHFDFIFFLRDAEVHPVFCVRLPLAPPPSCSPSSARHAAAAHQTLFRLIRFSSRAGEPGDERDALSETHTNPHTQLQR